MRSLRVVTVAGSHLVSGMCEPNTSERRIHVGILGERADVHADQVVRAKIAPTSDCTFTPVDADRLFAFGVWC